MKRKRKIGFKTFIAVQFLSMILATTFIVNASGVNSEENETLISNELYMTDSMLVSSSDTNYKEYLKQYENKNLVDGQKVVINPDQLDQENSKMEGLKVDENGVVTTETGYVSFNFNVEKAGMYHLAFNYLPIKGKGSAIERKIYIDGRLPYDELARISFDRMFTDASEVERANGNDIRPDQSELFEEMRTYIYDRERMYEDPLMIYLEAGEHSITIESVSEPMEIKEIAFEKAAEIVDYETYISNLKANGIKEVDSAFIKIQGEDTYRKNSVSLYPRMNNSNALTQPSHPSKIRLNVIGGDSWRFAGDWVEWEVEAEEEGLYQLSFRANQNFKRGYSSYRAITVNGEVPFEEAKGIKFNYDSAFQMVTLGEKEPMLIHLKEGKNIIKLEVVLGEMSQVINETNLLIMNLNEIYRQILLVTGATPDTYRDYNLPTVIPDLMDKLMTETERLKEIISDIETISGGRSEATSSLYTSFIQLEKFIKYPDEIHVGLTEFNSNNAALGTWVQTMKEQPVEIDYLLLTNAKAELPKVNGNFFENAWYETQRFVSSFFTDYDTFVTETGEYNKKIEVWVITGRDQSDILRRLIDDSFTPATGICVDVKLVPETVVLPATLSGEGPDVVIQLKEESPVNYALRNALVDLTEFEDFETVATRFDDSALTPFTLNKGVYALPDEQIHQMMFYREDILSDLGIDVPQTWNDIFEMLPILNRNHLDFFMDTTVIDTQSGQSVPNTTYSTILFQHGGEYYVNNGETSGLNSKESMEAFKFWTDFYTNYGLPVAANFYNRMRTGEIPIGIASYTNYNMLSVFAPEISGSWKMAPVPTYIDDSGNENNMAASYSKGSVIFKQSEDKESAWEFLKWWTSKETQVDFGTELETVLGVAARHASANEEAIYELPWPSQDIEQLKKQRESLQGVPQVPGGYMTAREVEYAFREVINNGSNPRETLYDYIEKIDNELALKRKEFGIE